MMAALFLWTVINMAVWVLAEYDEGSNRRGFAYKAWLASFVLWVIYGTIVVTYILWWYLP